MLRYAYIGASSQRHAQSQYYFIIMYTLMNVIKFSSWWNIQQITHCTCTMSFVDG